MKRQLGSYHGFTVGDKVKGINGFHPMGISPPLTITAIWENDSTISFCFNGANTHEESYSGDNSSDFLDTHLVVQQRKTTHNSHLELVLSEVVIELKSLYGRR